MSLTERVSLTLAAALAVAVLPAGCGQGPTVPPTASVDEADAPVAARSTSLDPEPVAHIPPAALREPDLEPTLRALATNDTSGAVVEIRADEKVFLGENPKVYASIRSRVPVLNKLLTRWVRVLEIDLIDELGFKVQNVEMVDCSFPPDVRDADVYVRLGPKEIQRYEASYQWLAESAPAVPGTYTMQVRFRPYLDKSIVYRQEFPLVIAELQPEDIVDRVILERPDVPGRQRMPAEFGEVMKVQDRGRYYLIHRNRGYGAAMVYRICELDADTRLAATLEFDESQAQPQIWVVYNRQGTQYRLRMSPFGSVLEDAKLGTANLHERYIEERYHRYPL